MPCHSDILRRFVFPFLKAATLAFPTLLYSVYKVGVSKVLLKTAVYHVHTVKLLLRVRLGIL
jgi:hypothetical protein